MNPNAIDSPLDPPPANGPNHLSKSTPKSKSFFKCENCRKRKIKCLPEERPEDQKCNPCQKSGFDHCPPNTKKTRPRKPLKTTATTTQPDPEHIESFSSSSIIAEQTVLKPRAIVVQPHKSSDSSSATPSLPYPPSASSNEHGDARRSDLSGSTYAKCCQLLSDVGPFIDLSRFVQHRHNALERMTNALPRLNISDVEAALGYFLRTIGSHIVACLRQLEEHRSQRELDGPQWELVTRRMVIAWQRFLGLHREKSDFLPTPENSWETYTTLKEELARYYQDNEDVTEADRLRFQCIESGEYLARCPMATLDSVASRISTAMKKALTYLDPKYKKTLDLKQSIEITASHLALMFLPRTSVTPAECPPTGGTGLTGRNTFLLAAEVGNEDYLEHHFRNSPNGIQEFLSARDIFGLTPLMVAAYTGNVEVFETLVKYGANLREQIPNGRGLLSLASMAGHLEIVQYISGHGVSIRQHIVWGSPIHDAAAAGRTEVVYFLIAKGAKPNEKYHGFTAAELAFQNGHHELAHSLGYGPSPTGSPSETESRPEKRQRRGFSIETDEVIQDLTPGSEGNTNMRHYEFQSSHEVISQFNMSTDNLPPNSFINLNAIPRSYPTHDQHSFDNERMWGSPPFDSMLNSPGPFGFENSGMEDQHRRFS